MQGLLKYAKGEAAMADIRNIADAASRRHNQHNQYNRFRQKHEKGEKKPDRSAGWENKLRKLKKINILAVFVIVVWSVILIAAAVKCGILSGFLGVFSDSLEGLFIALVTAGFTSLASAIYNIVKKNRGYICLSVFSLCFVIIMLLFINTVRLIALNEDKKTTEKFDVVQEEQVEQQNQMSQGKPIETGSVYEKKRYSFKDDLFINEVDAYYGEVKGTIDEAKAPEMRAQLILTYIGNEKGVRKQREIPQNFWYNCEIADFQYSTYLDQLERAGKVKRESILPEIKSKRLRDLEDAKEYRILANDKYEDSDNQRLLALYCIDLCDEYLRDKNINYAQANLVEGAQWAVQSICNAAVDGNEEKTEKGYQVLEKIVDRLEKMSGEIGGENIERIRNCRDAYKIVLQNIK